MEQEQEDTKFRAPQFTRRGTQWNAVTKKQEHLGTHIGKADASSSPQEQLQVTVNATRYCMANIRKKPLREILTLLIHP